MGLEDTAHAGATEHLLTRYRDVTEAVREDVPRGVGVERVRWDRFGRAGRQAEGAESRLKQPCVAAVEDPERLRSLP